MGTGGTPSLQSPKSDVEIGSRYGLQLRLNIDGPQPRRLAPQLLCIHSKFYGQAERAISNGQLSPLLDLHIRPINVVVYDGPSEGLSPWEISSRGRFRAYMHSALILTRLRYSAMPLA